MQTAMTALSSVVHAAVGKRLWDRRWWLAAALAVAQPVAAGVEHQLIAKATRTINLKTTGAPRVLTVVQLFIMRPGATEQECRSLLDSVQEVSPDPIGKRECVNELVADMLPALSRQPVPGAYSLSYRAMFPGYGGLLSIELFYPPAQRRHSTTFCPKYVAARKASKYWDVKCLSPSETLSVK